MVSIQTRFHGARIETRTDRNGAWAELFAAPDHQPGVPVLAWEWGATEREALAELRVRLSHGDRSTPCRLCAGPGVVTLTAAELVNGGHPSQGRVLSPGSALCRVCFENARPVLNLDGEGVS